MVTFRWASHQLTWLPRATALQPLEGHPSASCLLWVPVSSFCCLIVDNVKDCCLIVDNVKDCCLIVDNVKDYCLWILWRIVVWLWICEGLFDCGYVKDCLWILWRIAARGPKWGCSFHLDELGFRLLRWPCVVDRILNSVANTLAMMMQSLHFMT